jgi:hypothetical protein
MNLGEELKEARLLLLFEQCKNDRLEREAERYLDRLMTAEKRVKELEKALAAGPGNYI